MDRENIIGSRQRKFPVQCCKIYFRPSQMKAGINFRAKVKQVSLKEVILTNIPYCCIILVCGFASRSVWDSFYKYSVQRELNLFLVRVV